MKERISYYLTESEIIELEKEYLDYLNKYPFIQINHSSYSELLEKVKRSRYNIGPYENITLFEASNRVATDLTLFEGVKNLFKTNLVSSNSKILIQLGTMQIKEKGDFSVNNSGEDLEGEVFDTAHTFFRNKLYKTLKKWKGYNRLKFIVFNKDVLEEDKCKRYFENRQSEYSGIKFLPVSSWHKDRGR